MKKVVVIGGGTGTYTVLSGLKHYPVDLTGIPSMFDNGGHTGELRDEYGVLPTGDVRRCLVALAEDDSDIRHLFNFRTKDNRSLGNYLLTALKEIHGSDAVAIQKAAQLIDAKGSVIPISIDDAHLCATYEDGTVVNGETNIDIPKHDGTTAITSVSLFPKAYLYRGAHEAIMDADLIVLGPGDLYTSVVPNLVVEGAADAINASTAKKVYVCNLMTKLGETVGFSASDHARIISNYVSLDAIICNSTVPSQERLDAYKKEHSHPVVVDDQIHQYAKEVIRADLMSDTSLVRHDSKKLAHSLMGVIYA